jgi:hypothetical protein
MWLEGKDAHSERSEVLKDGRMEPTTGRLRLVALGNVLPFTEANT